MVQLYQRPDTPNIRQGNLQIYPGTNTSRYVHTISLDPSYSVQNIQDLSSIVESYPVHKSSHVPPEPYVHCWFDNPTYKKPCFFDQGWLGDVCSKANDYGYSNSSSSFSPCFLIRIEDTTDWAPEALKPEYIADSWKHEHDPSFLGLGCRVKEGDTSGASITRYPKKGFSIHFFPVNKFEPETYLLPAVMVRLEGIRKYSSATIECWIRTHNKYSLTDNGFITIKFVDNKDGAEKLPLYSGTTTHNTVVKSAESAEQPEEGSGLPNSSTSFEAPITPTSRETTSRDPANSTANTTTTTEDEYMGPIVS